MENEKKFVDGLFVNDKGNAPEFINAKLGITPKFIEYYNNNCDAKGNLRIDIKTAKSGKQYAELNDWKPQTDAKVDNGLPNVDMYGNEALDLDKESEINVDEIPF